MWIILNTVTTLNGQSCKEMKGWVAFGRRLQGACKELFAALLSLRVSRGKWVFKLKMVSKYCEKKKPERETRGKRLQVHGQNLKSIVCTFGFLSFPIASESHFLFSSPHFFLGKTRDTASVKRMLQVGWGWAWEGVRRDRETGVCQEQPCNFASVVELPKFLAPSCTNNINSRCG